MSAVPALPIALPALDNTLGALYIGTCLSTLLYGVICVQTFLYITSSRARSDRWWLKTFVFVCKSFTQPHVLQLPIPRQGLDTVNQGMMVAGMYRFLVSDFANPIALEGKGAGGGKALTTYASPTFFSLGLLLILILRQDESIIGLGASHTAASKCLSPLFVLFMPVHSFFCWRIWRFSTSSLSVWMRISFVAIMVPLAFFNFASYVAMGIFGFQHSLHSPNAPNFTLVIKLAASSGIAFDVIMTLAMIMSLQRARSGVVRSDHVITLLTLFTVNTNLITTLLSVGSLVTFLVLPDATIYGGIFFLIAKSYLNSFLAILNSREYLREKMDPSMSKHETELSRPMFAQPAPAHTITTRQMEESGSGLAPSNDSSTKV
ncbi:uncharacterized protein EV420DRAFT_1663341 [Desarmillaria tabescens]|uniref:DUF6534 domain-containing protein n=1 Tax=Armillaria tabescens TaxID=1929756 RepID=A0AA39NQV9_ARMTA|nr:uncharacterized protein EV420DRAFT_1663341 [Desarmillaria tabescens]KAK0470155.1 hypothetical protein EV420DRAFT_1663341 [Desarmillaria tabescens]